MCVNCDMPFTFNCQVWTDNRYNIYQDKWKTQSIIQELLAYLQMQYRMSIIDVKSIQLYEDNIVRSNNESAVG